jgi:hypothetical protein
MMRPEVDSPGWWYKSVNVCGEHDQVTRVRQSYRSAVHDQTFWGNRAQDVLGKYFLLKTHAPGTKAPTRIHQPPEMNYWAVLTFGEIKQEVHSQVYPAGEIDFCENLDSSLLVAGGCFAAYRTVREQSWEQSSHDCSRTRAAGEPGRWLDRQTHAPGNPLDAKLVNSCGPWSLCDP